MYTKSYLRNLLDELNRFSIEDEKYRRNVFSGPDVFIHDGERTKKEDLLNSISGQEFDLKMRIFDCIRGMLTPLEYNVLKDREGFENEKPETSWVMIALNNNLSSGEEAEAVYKRALQKIQE